MSAALPTADGAGASASAVTFAPSGTKNARKIQSASTANAEVAVLEEHGGEDGHTEPETDVVEADDEIDTAPAGLLRPRHHAKGPQIEPGDQGQPAAGEEFPLMIESR